jgi:hypothetical protein
MGGGIWFGLHGAKVLGRLGFTIYDNDGFRKDNQRRYVKVQELSLLDQTVSHQKLDTVYSVFSLMIGFFVGICPSSTSTPERRSKFHRSPEIQLIVRLPTLFHLLTNTPKVRRVKMST